MKEGKKKKQQERERESETHSGSLAGMLYSLVGSASCHDMKQEEQAGRQAGRSKT